jgi:hypothetical protein
MAIAVTNNHFTQRDQAVSEIQANGLRLIEADVTADKLCPEVHAHPFHVDIYVLDGTFELHDTDSGLTHLLKAGSKATVPTGTRHSEGPSAFRGVFGISADAAPQA